MASGSTGSSVGACVTLGVIVGITVSEVGIKVAVLGLVSSSGSSKTSPRETEGRTWGFVRWWRFKGEENSSWLFSETVTQHSTDLFWGRWCKSPHSSFHNTHTWSHTDICSVGWRSRSDLHRTLWESSFSVRYHAACRPGLSLPFNNQWNQK